MTALVLTTKNNQTQHYIHQKHKRETEKTALANKTIYILIWYGFYYLRSGNRVGPILTAPESTRGRQTDRRRNITAIADRALEWKNLRQNVSIT